MHYVDDREHGMRLFWSTVGARAYPRIFGLARELSWLFFDTFLPLLGTCAYVFVYQALDAPPEFVGFVVIGGAMTAFWLNVLWSMASQLYWDKDAGNLELYILSPAPLPAILLGMAVGGLVNTGLRATVIVVACSLLFGVDYQITNLPLLIVIFASTMMALYGMGMLFASVFLVSGREAWHMANLFQEPIYFVSGIFFPIKALGTWVAIAASFIPMTLGMDAIRQLAFQGGPTLGFLAVEIELGILLGLTVVFVGGALWSLRKLETEGRRNGRLTERRR